MFLFLSPHLLSFAQFFHKSCLFFFLDSHCSKFLHGILHPFSQTTSHKLPIQKHNVLGKKRENFLNMIKKISIRFSIFWKQEREKKLREMVYLHLCHNWHRDRFLEGPQLYIQPLELAGPFLVWKSVELRQLLEPTQTLTEKDAAVI